MYSCVAACFVRKWNLHVGCISSLLRVSSKVLNGHTANNDSLGYCTHFDRDGSDAVAACDFLGIFQQFQPFMLLLNCCLHSGANRRHQVAKSSQYIALTETFKSFFREFSSMYENNEKVHCTRGNHQTEHSVVYANAVVPDFNCHGMLHGERLDTRMLPVMKRFCHSYLPLPSTENLLNVVQQQFRASRSFHYSTGSVSQKRDKDSYQKPNASQLSNVQQLMMEQVV